MYLRIKAVALRELFASAASPTPRTELWSVREKAPSPQAEHMPAIAATENSPSLLYPEWICRSKAAIINRDKTRSRRSAPQPRG